MEPNGTPLEKEKRMFTPGQFQKDLERGRDNWLRSALNANGQYPTDAAIQAMVSQPEMQLVIDNLTKQFRKLQAEGIYQNPPEV